MQIFMGLSFNKFEVFDIYIYIYIYRIDKRIENINGSRFIDQSGDRTMIELIILFEFFLKL